MIEDLKPYPQYKDSGLPWLGEVPRHWETARSKRLFRQRKEFAQSDDQQLSATQAFGVIPQALYEQRTGYRVVKISMHLDKRKHVEADDFVISMRSFQGGLERAWAAGAIRSSYVVLEPSAEVSAGYFQHLFKSHQYINALRATSDFIRDGQDLNFGNFCGVDLPLIPLQEQAAIARFLAWATNRLDRAIGAKRRIIVLLQEQKQAIIHRAVTRGLDPTAPLKDSGIPWLGEIPEHWEVTRVKSEFGCLNFRRIPLSTTERGKMKLRQYDYYGASGIIDKVDEYIFDDNLILIAEDGANLVNRNLPLAIIARGKYWVNNHAHILMPRKGSLEYLAALLECMDYRPWISGAAQPKLTQDRLMSIRIALPPPEEQSRIVEAFNKEAAPIELSIRELLQEVNLLREYRTRLIADVVTGKLDVRKLAAGLPEQELQDQPDVAAGYDADEAEDDAEFDLIDTAED